MVFATKQIQCLLIVWVLSAGLIKAEEQDVLLLKDGQSLKGEVQRVAPDGTITFKFDQGTIPYRKEVIKSLTLAPRPEFKAGVAAAHSGKHDEAISKLQPIVDKFLGVSSAWVGQAAGELANSLAQTGKTFESEELAKRIIALYPDSLIRLTGPITQANTMLERNPPQVDQALALLEKVKGELPQVVTPSPQEMQVLGDYHMAMGRVMEQRGQKREALEHYLTVSTLYYEPKSRMDAAERRANALREADPKLTVR